MIRVPLSVLVLVFLAGASPSRPPAEPALSSLSKLQASKMGVDHAGNFWAWQRQSGEVKVLAPGGQIVRREHLFGASSVDVDAEWGVVGLLDSGRELQWMDWDGKTVSIPFSGPVADLCWIGPFTVAVTPQMATDRIEIWNVRDRFPVKSVGREAEIQPATGATRLRGVLLRYDFRNELLYSLESFTGDLQVYRSNGSLAWSTTVENPERKLWEDWLRDVDRTAKQSKDIQTPTIFSLKLALSSDGSPWIVQSQDSAGRKVMLVRPDPKGNQTLALQDEPCPSSSFTLWKDHLILSRDPAALQGACSSVRKFP